MKKSFITFNLITLSLIFVLSITSCSNLFSKGSDDEPTSQTATFIGNIKIDSVLGSDFITNDSRSARPAPINMETNTYKYFVKAEDENHLTYTSEDSESKIQLSGNTFEATLPLNGKWTITVSLRENGSTDDILKDSVEKTLNAASPTFQYDFFLKPVTEGTGDFSLTMYVNKKAGITEADPNYVNKLEVTLLYKPVGASLSDTELSLSADKTSFTYYRASSTETVKPGTYKILFTFKHGDTPVFSTLQAINIVRGLITNKWVGGTSTLIKPDGTFELTEELIEAWRLRRTDYYVGGTGASDTNTGSPDDPLATLRHAIELVNDIEYGNTTVKIHMAKGHTENLNSETLGLEIKNYTKVLIDVWNKAGETATPRILRASSLGGAIIKILSGCELTIDGIIIAGGNANSSGNCGIYNAGTFTLKSGEITGNNNIYSSTTNHGAGIYSAGTLNLLGGSITGNQMVTSEGLGGGIYVFSGLVNLSGAVTIKDNGNTNLYLSSGSKITITGSLEEGTNKSEIYISTADAVTKDSAVTFTEDYGFYGTGYNAGKFPGRYFIGENATVTYKHAEDVTAPEAGDGEAQLAVSAGQIINPLSDIDVTFSLSKNKFMEGSDASEALRTIKIIPKYIINDTPLSGTALTAAIEETNWKIDMYVGDKAIEGCSWTDQTILIPTTVTYHDTYTLVVRASYKGITFDSEFILNEPSSYVQTAPYSWRGTTAELATLTRASTVFIANRTIDIPALLVCDHETTQEEYEKYCRYNSSKPSDDLGKGANYPAYYISWYDAVVYCNLKTLDDSTFGSTRAERLSHCVYKLGDDKDPVNWSDIVAGTGTETGKYCGPTSNNASWNAIIFDQEADGWRLPTEAEWEFLARGGNTDNYRYSGSNNINEVAWYNGNSGTNGGSSNKTTHEVKGKKPNRLCLYDMNGNVWEWCWDWVGTITSSTASTGVSSGEKRRLGGGSWYSPDGRDINSHGDESPDIGNNGLGFRVVRTVTE